MAELGNIPFLNPNQGTRVVDRRAESNAIGQGLDVAKKTIDEGVKGLVTGQMLEAIEEVAEQEQPEALDTRQDIFDYPPGSRENYLVTRMDRLNAAIEQGRSSQQTAAINGVKAVLAEAQMHYPWLYDELRGRANAVIQGSVELDQLGISDAAAQEQAKAAAGEMKEIVEHGRKSWDDGGLGIRPEIDPMSPYWARLYTKRSHQREVEERAARETGLAIANAKLDAANPLFAQEIRQQLQGQFSGMAATILELKDRHQYYDFLDELNKGDRGDLQFIEQWKTVYATEFKADLMNQKAGITQLYNNLKAEIPLLQETPHGKALDVSFRDTLADIDQWINQIEQLKDDAPNAMQIIERGMEIRSNDAFKQIPDVGQTQLAFFTAGPGKFMLEMAAHTKNAAGVNLLNRFGIANQTYMSDLWPEVFDPAHPQYPTTQQAAVFNSTGALKIPPGASAAAIQAAIDDRMKSPNNTWVVPASNNQEQTILALQNGALHLALFEQGESVLNTADPEFANNTLLGMTYSLSYLNSDQVKPPNVQQEVLNYLSNKSLDNAVNISLSGESRGERQAFAAEAAEYYHSTNPAKKRAEMALYYKNHRVGGQALSELVKVDVNALDDNKFSYIIEPEALERAAQQIAAGRGTGRDIAGARIKAEADVNAAMAEIQVVMDQQIGIEMLLNKAKANNEATMQAANEWVSHFLGAGIPGASGNTWADIFNYTEGSVSRSR